MTADVNKKAVLGSPADKDRMKPKKGKKDKKKQKGKKGKRR